MKHGDRASMIVLVATLLAGCGGGRHFQVVAEGPARNAPHYVVVTQPPQVATLHFPPGIYKFYAQDDNGFYYRAPEKIEEHVAGGAVPLDGGVYVSRKRAAVVRPYVYRGGALTHVGKLKRGTYEFQDEPSLP